jgi:hypothetical protein
MYALDVAALVPLLDREVKNVDLPSSFSRSIRVHHADGSLVIFIQQYRSMEGKQARREWNASNIGDNQALRHGMIGASDGDVVDLSVQKDDIPVHRTSSVDTSLICGVHDIEVVQDLAGVLCSTGFGVSLKDLEHLLQTSGQLSGVCLQGLEHWKHQRAVNFLSIAKAKPVGVVIVDPNVCRLGRRRGVGIGVSVFYALKTKHKRIRGWSMHEAYV